jgi:hypothetical protein
MNMNDSDKQVFKQREFLRLRTSLPVRLMYLPKDGRVPDTEWAAGTMSEIGGGGARIQAYMEMEVDDALTIRFVIPDTEHELKLYARVVNATRIDFGTAVNVKFVGLSDEDRGAILRYAFREQIRRAKDPVDASGQSSSGVGDDGQSNN